MNADYSLVDKIYEAALVPELWNEVCVQLADVTDCYSAMVVTMSPDGDYRWISTPNIRELMATFAASDLRFQNVRPQRGMEVSPGIFARDSDVLTPEELENDPIYRTYIYPNGLKWNVGCAIREPSGHFLVFDLMRTKDANPFSDAEIARLNALKPDLARAAFLTSRLAFRQAATMAAALSMVGLPAAIISDHGAVLAMNPEMEAFERVVTTRAGDVLHVINPAPRAMFDEAIARLNTGRAAEVQSIPVPATEADPAVILHVVPVRRQARDVFGRSLAVVIATRVGDAGPPDLRVLSGLFDLTPAESRVAREVATGASLEMIAAKLKLSIQTVRTYLKRVMAKTGTRRQAELAVLLSGLHLRSGG